MNSFVNAITAPQVARTENGMKANSHTGSALLDLFSKIGSGRGRNLDGELYAALAESKEMTVKVLLWARDVLEGAGERETVRALLRKLEIYEPELALRVMPKLVELGRVDDLLFSFSVLEKEAFEVYSKLLKDGNKLAFKWAPREKSAKKKVAAKLRAALGMSPAQYRKYLASNTEVVEQQMSSKDWKEINYSHVPSVAANRYKSAFMKNDTVRYNEYLTELAKPAETRAEGVKINAKAIFPHDIVHGIFKGDVRAADAQWEALPNFVGDANILPIVDTSGSMMSPLAGNVYALEVAISLGLYFSYKASGPFKDVYATFSDSCQFNILKGTLSQRVSQMRSDSKWGGSTNLHSAFDRILDTAQKNAVPEEDMPDYLMILSDMEFNGCVRHDDSALEMMRRKYKQSGYKMPGVIFWNLTSRNESSPVKVDDKGTVIVSGFSPAVAKSILDAGAEEFEPYAMMMKTIDRDRYNF